MSHRTTFAYHLKSLGHIVFRKNRIDGICLENPCQQLCFLSMSLPPNGPLPELFLEFPVRALCRRFHLAPSQRSSPQYSIPQSIHLKLSPPSTLSSLPSRSFPALPTLFPMASRPCTSAPSQHSSPQAISHSFPSVPTHAKPVEVVQTIHFIGCLRGRCKFL